MALADEPPTIGAGRNGEQRQVQDDRTARIYWTLLVAPLLMLTLFYLYPLGKVLWLSVSVPKLGFGNFAQLYASSAVQRIIMTTARISAMTTVICLILGYILAYAALHVRSRQGELMMFFVLLCFWLSVLIRAFAWLALLQSRGVINTALIDWGVISEPLTLVRNEFGIVVGMVHYMIPYAVLPLYANMKGIDQRLVPAARGLGASPWEAFWRVYLPMCVPGILSAGILVFIFSLGFYVTPSAAGRRQDSDDLGVHRPADQRHAQLGAWHDARDEPPAHRLRAAGADEPRGRSQAGVRRQMMIERTSGGFRFTVFGAWLIVLFLVLPMTIVVPVSFTPERYLSLPHGTLSLRHYEALLNDPVWIRSIRDSAIVATSATALAVVLGTLTAIGCWRISSRASEFVRMLMLAPMIVPAIVHALGFYQAWVQFGLIDTYIGLILAHAMKGVPYVVISVSAALVNVELKLEQAARSLGATVSQTLRMVIVPAAMPGVYAGAVFAFVTSWDELVVNLFVTSRNVYTLPRKIWDGIQDNINPAIAAVATLLMLLTLVLVLARRLTQKSEQEAT